VARGKAKLSGEYVLLCEGAHDAQFFKHLILTRHLPSFDISACGHAAGRDRGGIGDLTDALDSLPNFGADFDRVKGILVVADNDSMPTGRK
jgi:hypothetical protein